MSKQRRNNKRITPEAGASTFSWASIAYRVPNTHVLLGIATILLAIVVCYLPSLHGGFVLDDNILLTENKLVHASNGLYRMWFTQEPIDYWPVTNTSFWIEWRLWCMNPTGYHITNMLLHAAGCLMVWAVLKKLNVPGAFFAALLFAVHPVNVESVAWISQRKNVLAFVFFFISLYAFLVAEEKRLEGDARFSPPGTRQGYFWSLAAFLLAMLSKGSVAFLPLVLVGIILIRRKPTWADIGRLVPFFFIAVALTYVNVDFASRNKNVFLNIPWPERFASAGMAIWFYLDKAIWPLDLVFIYPKWKIETSSIVGWIPLAAVFSVSFGLWYYRKTWSRPILFAWGYFCLALLPVLGLTRVGYMRYSPVADHYQHLALLGILALIAAGWGLWRLWSKPDMRWTADATAGVFVLLLIFLCREQNALYKDALTLYGATLEKNPHCWLARNNMAKQLADEGRLDDSLREFKKAIDDDRNEPKAYSNLGKTLLDARNYTEALPYLEQANEMIAQADETDPDSLKILNNLGLALVGVQRIDEGIEYFKKAIALKPDFADPYCSYGIALSAKGALKEALEYFEKAVKFDPNEPKIRANYGNGLSNLERYSEAIEQYKEALRLNPDFPEALNNLGSAFIYLNRHPEAIEPCKKAIALKPNYVDAHLNLGLAYRAVRRYGEAIEQFQQTVRFNPSSLDARLALIETLAGVGRISEALQEANKASEIARAGGDAQFLAEIETWKKTPFRQINATISRPDRGTV